LTTRKTSYRAVFKAFFLFFGWRQVYNLKHRINPRINIVDFLCKAVLEEFSNGTLKFRTRNNLPRLRYRRSGLQINHSFFWLQITVDK
jgi:hypothetical protein